MNVKRGEQCSHCGRYNSRHVVANGVVVKDGKVLLVKRGIEPEIRKWALPGGYMDWDETIEETVVREVREETGVEAEVRFMIGVYSSPKRRNDPNQNVAISFALTPVTIDLKPQVSEIEELKWVDLQAIPEDTAFDHDDIIQAFLRKEVEGRVVATVDPESRRIQDNKYGK